MSPSPPGQPGRPRSLDEAKRRQVCLLVAAGCGIQEAARLLGCSATTIRREMKRNAAFGQEVGAAQCNAQLDSLAAMRKAASTHWRAAAWMLERTSPHFARFQAAGYKPEEVRHVVEQVILTAAEGIADPDDRERQCRRMFAAALRSTRALDAARAAKANPPWQRPTPSSPQDAAIDRLLADIDHNRVEACKFLMNKTQKPNFINRAQ